MIQRVNQSFFTLLELLVVLFIISLGVMLTGIKIKEVYREQQFLSEAQQVLSYLSMAQDLMLIMDTDVQVKMVKEAEEIKVWLEVEKPLELVWARFIERKLKLKAIHAYEFTEDKVRKSKNKELTLQFSLGRMTQGLLVLFDQNAKNDSSQSTKGKFNINLMGYPTPIGLKNAMAPKKKESRLLYPSEVYEKLYEKPDKKKSPF